MQGDTFELGGKVVCVKVVDAIDKPYFRKTGVITELQTDYDCAVVDFSESDNETDEMTMFLFQLDTVDNED